MKKRLVRAFLAVNTLMLIQHTTTAQVSLTTIGTAYTQNFDGYTATSAATLPAGWTVSGSFTFRGQGNGGSNSGGSWSYGATTADGSLGFLGSTSSTNITYGVTFVNNTGSVINSLDISYNFENWRFAGGNNIGFTVTSSGALAGSSGAVSAGLTQTSAASPATVPKSVTISGLAIAVGATFGLSFASSDGGGTDNGKAVDDFSITPKVSQPSLNINNVTLSEGNAGTTNFNFMVSLTSPAGAGGVTFDIATTDQTATTADNDYTATSLTAQTIPAGATSYTFTVPVNGDLNVESNESFFANVTNVTGALISDGQGLGTINNDDYIAPAVTGDPTGGAYCNGALVTYTASATGIPTPTVQWQMSTDGGMSYSNAGGTSATTTTYTFIAMPGMNGNMYQAVFTNPGGSATAAPVTLTVNPTYSVSQTTAVCSGGSYTYPDGTIQTNITTTASHTSHLMSIGGCDSAIVTTVTVNPVYSFTESFSICSGTDYTFPDGTTMTGIATVTIHTSNLASTTGCDSVIVTTLNINPSYSVMDTVWVCSGSDYTFGDGTVETNVTSGMSHTSFLFSMQFCDSIVSTTVNVYPVYTITDTVAICSGTDYTFPDGTTQTNITTTTTYTSNLTSVYGCDSTIVRTVNANPVYNLSQTVAVCNGMAYTFPDGTVQDSITTVTTYTSNLTTINGCDSIIVTTVNINPVYSLAETVTICSGMDYTFPDGTMLTNIIAPVVYTSSLSTAGGCDSIVVTTLNVNPSYSTSQSVAICSGTDYTFPDGTTQTNITSATVYTSSFNTINGCDSIIVTTVSVNPIDTIAMSQSICVGDSVSFYGSYLSLTGTYYYSLTSMAGCDSVVELNLTVNALPSVGFDFMGGTISSICAEMEDTLYLNGGMPAGGVYSGPFSAGDTLYPQELVNSMGGGNYIFGYIYTDVSTGCSAMATDTLAIAYCVGMKENAGHIINVAVYPNPAHDHLTVEPGPEMDGAMITLTNTLGQIILVKQTDTRSTSLDLSDLRAGIYYLSIESRSAKVTRKIVVE